MNTEFRDKLLIFIREYWESLPDGDLDQEEYYTTPQGHFEREIIKFLEFHQFELPDFLKD